MRVTSFLMLYLVAVVWAGVLGAVYAQEATPAAQPAKPRIGVMKFEVSKDLDPALGTFLYSTLTAQVVATGKYTVVDWEEINRVLGFIAKSQPNVSTEDAKKLAINQLGIQKMFLGTVLKIGGKYQIIVKVLNLDLSVDRVEQAAAENEDRLEPVIKELAPRLILSGKEMEDELWKQAQAADTEDAYARFVKSYPESIHAADAIKKRDLLVASRERDEKLRSNVAGHWQLAITKSNDQPVAAVAVVVQDGLKVVLTYNDFKYAGTYKDGQLNCVCLIQPREVYARYNLVLTLNRNRTLSGKLFLQRGGALPEQKWNGNWDYDVLMTPDEGGKSTPSRGG